MKVDLKYANVYLLQGTTIIGDATVMSNSLSDNDATNLLHIHHEHMSKLGLAELSKK